MSQGGDSQNLKTHTEKVVVINRNIAFYNGVRTDIVKEIYEFIKECLFTVNDALTGQPKKKKKSRTKDNPGVRSNL